MPMEDEAVASTGGGVLKTFDDTERAPDVLPDEDFDLPEVLAAFLGALLLLPSMPLTLVS